MRIALPVWEDRISPVLDTASRLLIIEVEKQRETSRFETTLDDQDLYRRCFRIQNLEVDILICGAISSPYFRRLIAVGIHIISGISGHPEDVLKAFIQGTLYQSRFSMPGCGGNGPERRMKHANSGKINNRGKDGEGSGHGRRMQSRGRYLNHSIIEEVNK
jgi:predicted Fe-Mo cluster-binding NifX family protein